MRLAGQQRCGFYAAPKEAVDAAVQLIDVSGPFSCLDPCAGEGAALAQITEGLGGTPFAIELDVDRGSLCAAKIQRTLHPASVFGCRVRRGGFDAMWVNPPYDDELGGGNRVEHTFLTHCYQWLKPKGLLMFVVPEHINGQYSPSVQFLRERFNNLAYIPFPGECRRFREIIIFGNKLPRVNADLGYYESRQLIPLCQAQRWIVPTGTGPGAFEKVNMTETELAEALARSPLQKALEAPPERPLPRPPLPPGKGHIAMLLASGHLDGIVRPDGEKPHVVRGVATKKDYLKEVNETEDEEGCVTRKTVYGQRVTLTLRAVDASGEIKTFEGE